MSAAPVLLHVRSAYEAVPIYQEIVDRLLIGSPKSHAALVTAMVSGARPKPMATLYVAGAVFVVRIDFEEPLRDGRDGMVLPLGIVTEREA